MGNCFSTKQHLISIEYRSRRSRPLATRAELWWHAGEWRLDHFWKSSSTRVKRQVFETPADAINAFLLLEATKVVGFTTKHPLAEALRLATRQDDWSQHWDLRQFYRWGFLIGFDRKEYRTRCSIYRTLVRHFDIFDKTDDVIYTHCSTIRVIYPAGLTRCWSFGVPARLVWREDFSPTHLARVPLTPGPVSIIEQYLRQFRMTYGDVAWIVNQFTRMSLSEEEEQLLWSRVAPNPSIAYPGLKLSEEGEIITFDFESALLDEGGGNIFPVGPLTWS